MFVFDCSFSISYCRLRSAYPHSDLSTNAGFVWSPSVGLDELHQGLGVSLKVTVISEHFREPLTFTCDGETLTDRPITNIADININTDIDDLVLYGLKQGLCLYLFHEEF